jgi:diaminohydroxyphosphoribosylaminopyrimidine deaminase/5-amino-6-(5-phosphoribosylamino)uracil reductase
VVVAVSDPNPVVCNKGIGELLRAGIVVDSGVLSQQAEQLNLGFFTRMRYHRPYIRCKLAMSLDGRTAMASGESQWITSQESRRDVQAWRAQSSAIMTGSGTVLSDNPLLTVRLAELPNYLPKPAILRQPLRVIVDTHLSTPTTARMLKAPGQTVIFTVSDNASLRTLLEKAGAQIVYLPSRDRRIDLEAMCHSLAEQYQVNELLLETGATLGGSMLQAGLCDELIIYIAPKLMGNKARGLLNLMNLDYLHQHVPLEINDIRAIGCDWRVIARPIVEVQHSLRLPRE